MAFCSSVYFRHECIIRRLRESALIPSHSLHKQNASGLLHPNLVLLDAASCTDAFFPIRRRGKVVGCPLLPHPFKVGCRWFFSWERSGSREGGRGRGLWLWMGWLEEEKHTLAHPACNVQDKTTSVFTRKYGTRIGINLFYLCVFATFLNWKA